MKYLSVVTLWVLFNISSFAQSVEVLFSSIPKEGTVLIFSHMDDDLIWMLPWWSISEKFIGGAVPSSPVYKTIVEKQQDYLDLNGYNIDYESNWYNPWGSITIEEYDKYYWAEVLDPAYSYLANENLLWKWDGNDPIAVRNEVNRIKAKLEQYIANPEVSRIITHNNWGEYGHQHHKAVNVAVRELAVKYRKDVWMLGCTYNPTDRLVDISLPDGITYASGNFNDPTLYNSIKYIYNYYWHWTFGPADDSYVPSGQHPFIKIVDQGVDWTASLPVLVYNPLVQDLSFDRTTTTPGPTQSRSGAYILDGIDDYLTLSSNQNTSFTYAMWVRPDEANKEMDISRLSEYPSSLSFDRNLVLNSNGLVTAHINDGTSKTVTSNSPLTTDNWTHVAVTNDGVSLKLFINGIQENEISAGFSAGTCSTPEFIVGQAALTSNFFEGQISDIRLFDYALSSENIAAVASQNPPVSYIISASTGYGGSITSSGERIVLEGTSVTYYINPSPYYAIENVTVDGVTLGSVNNYIFTNVTGNHTIAVTFSSHTGNIALEKTTTCSSFSGQPCYLMWDASHANDADGSNSSSWVAEGSLPQWWRVDLGNIYDISYLVVRNSVSDPNFIDRAYYNYEIWAFSSETDSTLIVQKSSNSPATVEGDHYSVNATARYLKVNITNCSPGSGAIISDFRAYGLLSTDFVKINSSSEIWGSITPAGDMNYPVGSDVTFNINADFGYEISDVIVDGRSVGAVSEFTFDNVNASHTIEGRFSSTMENVALGKTTTAESFQDNDPWWGPSQAVDADPGTMWATNVADQWWKIDLGAVYDISYIVIRGVPDADCLPRYYHYNIQSSIDDLTYTQIAEKTNNNVATDKGDIYIMEFRTRYIMVNMISNSRFAGVQISDFRAYGNRTPGFWTGVTSSDWNTLSNWNHEAIPNSVDDVIITPVSVNQPVISGPTAALCRNLDIHSGASLTISPSGSATFGTIVNNGTLNLLSDDNSTPEDPDDDRIASLILDSYTDNGNENIQLFLTGGGTEAESNYKWHYISVPVTTPVDLYTNLVPAINLVTQDLARFEEGGYSGSQVNDNTGWIAYDGYRYSDNNFVTGFSALELGKGYDYWDAVNNTFSFSGTINTGNTNIPLLYNGGAIPGSNQYGFNLVGNPFTSGLNWDVISNSGSYPSNTSKAIFFTKDNIQYTYSNGVGIPESANAHVPPMQGFFIKTYSSGNTLRIPVEAREHNATPRYKGQGDLINLVRLTLDENGKSDETVVRFDNLAKTEVDYDFDAVKMYETYSSPSISSLSNSLIMAINGLPFPETITEVPLVLRIGQTSDGKHTIKAKQLQGLDDYLVFLTDKKNGITVDLKTNPDYTFSDLEGLITNRFILTIEKVTTGIDNPNFAKPSFLIYNAFEFINIRTISDEWEGLTGTIKLMNLTGKIITTNSNKTFFKDFIIQIPEPDKPGVYLVELRSGIKRFVAKVIVR